MQTFKHQTKSSIFQTIIKFINICWGFKPYCDPGAQKVGVKMDFKGELIRFKLTSILQQLFKTMF